VALAAHHRYNTIATTASLQQHHYSTIATTPSLQHPGRKRLGAAGSKTPWQAGTRAPSTPQFQLKLSLDPSPALLPVGLVVLNAQRRGEHNPGAQKNNLSDLLVRVRTPMSQHQSSSEPCSISRQYYLVQYLVPIFGAYLVQDGKKLNTCACVWATGWEWRCGAPWSCRRRGRERVKPSCAITKLTLAHGFRRFTWQRSNEPGGHAARTRSDARCLLARPA